MKKRDLERRINDLEERLNSRLDRLDNLANEASRAVVRLTAFATELNETLARKHRIEAPIPF